MWAYVTGLVLVCVLSLSSGRRVQTGEIDCGNSDNWASVSSDDPNKDNTRENSQIVKFDTPFCRSPKVFLTPSYLDVPYDKNLRYNTRLYSVSPSQFNASCYTWHDSVVHGMKVSWFAIDN